MRNYASLMDTSLSWGDLIYATVVGIRTNIQLPTAIHRILMRSCFLVKITIMAGKREHSIILLLVLRKQGYGLSRCQPVAEQQA